MNFIDRTFTLRNLILAKVVILTAAWAGLEGYLSFGDISLMAQDNAETAQQKADESDNEAESAETRGDAKSSTRKSLLEGLLELPSINPDEISREELGRYLALVERKEQQVKERLELLNQREDQLKALENGVEEKIQRLAEERKFFSETIQKEKVLKDERTKTLADFYSKMKPKVAAPIFEKLDRDLVVELFGMMPQKQIRSILTVMQPDESVRITEYYGRIRSGREYDVLREMNTSLVDEFQKCKGMPE